MSSRPWNSRPFGPNKGQKFADELVRKKGAPQIYIGKGIILDRFREPDRRKWGIQKIEYSIVRKGVQYEWEKYWLDNFKEAERHQKEIEQALQNDHAGVELFQAQEAVARFEVERVQLNFFSDPKARTWIPA